MTERDESMALFSRVVQNDSEIGLGKKTLHIRKCPRIPPALVFFRNVVSPLCYPGFDSFQVDLNGTRSHKHNHQVETRFLRACCHL